MMRACTLRLHAAASDVPCKVKAHHHRDGLPTCLIGRFNLRGGVATLRALCTTEFGCRPIFVSTVSPWDFPRSLLSMSNACKGPVFPVWGGLVAQRLNHHATRRLPLPRCVEEPRIDTPEVSRTVLTDIA